MNQKTKRIVTFFFLFSFYQSGICGPWFTGPLLAPAGHTIAKGHTNFELYGFNSFNNAMYDRFGKLKTKPLFHSVVVEPVITHGFTDWLDVQLATPYVFNATLGKNANRLGDVSAALGFQLFEQNNSPKRADVRLIVQEVFPTGRFEHLNPLLASTDSTGFGSYQTLLALDLQYLREILPSHYLRTRFILNHLYSSPVSVHGLNSYGGSLQTRGRISSTTEDGVDLAFEYTLTQHWVGVLEGTYFKGSANVFHGELNIGGNEGDVTVGDNGYWVKTLAPALEYNFNESIGVIAGVWFPIGGRDTSRFINYVMALNVYW